MSYTSSIPLPDFDLWKRTDIKRLPWSFEIDATARCNLNCRHCYINLPAGDRDAKSVELSLCEIESIAQQAVALGSLWCLISGGEPLLRPDFISIYLALRRLGLLVSVFTNATLLTSEHIALFKKYPPRSLEVTVYGVTQETYERVTRRPGSYAAFRRGLDLLFEGGIDVTLKTMALQSNVNELPAIADFCRQHTHTNFRFDPFLHLRYDGDPQRNAEISSERLSPAQIVAIEQADEGRLRAVQKKCRELIQPVDVNVNCAHIFSCGVGTASFNVTYNGFFRLCTSLSHPSCMYDLRQGSLIQAWQEYGPQVRKMRSSNQQFLEHCHRCALIDLCMWCPATAHLESGQLDNWVEYFCQVAHARYEAYARPTLDE